MSKQQVQVHNEYFDRAEERGANVVSFECSGCGFNVRTLAPQTENTVWTSMLFCPSCEKPYFKHAEKHSLEVSDE